MAGVGEFWQTSWVCRPRIARARPTSSESAAADDRAAAESPRRTAQRRARALAGARRCAARDRRARGPRADALRRLGKERALHRFLVYAHATALAALVGVQDVPVHAGDIDPQPLHRRRAVGRTAAAGVLADGARRGRRAATRARARCSRADRRNSCTPRSSSRFCYHLVAGIRHLVWDTGRGLERAQARRSAWLVVGGERAR